MASDYEQLVKALRCRATYDRTNCGNCKYSDEEFDPKGCLGTEIFDDAASAIEALQAEFEKKLTADCFRCKCENVEPKRGEFVEVVRCKDCDSWDTEQSSGRKSLGNYVCVCQEWSDGEDARWVYTGENEYCSRGEPKEKMEVQDVQSND